MGRVRKFECCDEPTTRVRAQPQLCSLKICLIMLANVLRLVQQDHLRSEIGDPSVLAAEGLEWHTDRMVSAE
jgi:hypothetical protein